MVFVRVWLKCAVTAKKEDCMYHILSVHSFCKFDFISMVSKIYSYFPLHRSVHDADSICTVVHCVRMCACEHEVYILLMVQC